MRVKSKSFGRPTLPIITTTKKYTSAINGIGEAFWRNRCGKEMKTKNYRDGRL